MSSVEKRHKGDIALLLLEDAYDSFQNEKYYSAIHLAGASAEVLCLLCEKAGLISPHVELKSMLSDLYNSDQNFFDKPKEALKAMDRVKNAIKHLDLKDDNDLYLICNPRLRAAQYINKANKAVQELGVEKNFEVQLKNDS